MVTKSPSATPNTAADALTLLSILKRIPKKRWISSTELERELEADGLGMARRRLQRHLKVLCAASDFDVVCDSRKKPFGYRRLSQKSDFAVTKLHPEEGLVLRLAEEQLRLLFPKQVLERLRPMFDAARESLKETEGEDPAAQWLKKVAVVPGTLPFEPPQILPRILSEVSDALWRGVKLDVVYRNSDDEEKEHTVSPLGLVQQDGRLYLVCQFDGYDNVRHLALHRLQSATAAPFAAERPSDFSLDRYVTERHFNYGNGKPVRLVFEFNAPHLRKFLEETPIKGQVMKTLKDGYTRVEAVVDDSRLIDAWRAVWGRETFRVFKRRPVKAPADKGRKKTKN